MLIPINHHGRFGFSSVQYRIRILSFTINENLKVQAKSWRRGAQVQINGGLGFCVVVHVATMIGRILIESFDFRQMMIAHPVEMTPNNFIVHAVQNDSFPMRKTNSIIDVII